MGCLGHASTRNSGAGIQLNVFRHQIVLVLFPLSVLQPIDYESKRSYTLRVEATNVRSEPSSGGPFKDTATVKVVVEDSDEPPVFLKPVYVLEVNENAPVNTVIGAVTARDPDSTGSLVR